MGDTLVSGSLDGRIQIFRLNNSEDWTRGYVKTSSLKIHKKEVSNLVFHPNGEYILSVSKDRSWAIVDIDGEVICHKKDEPSEVISSDYHPGGGMIAIGELLFYVH